MTHRNDDDTPEPGLDVITEYRRMIADVCKADIGTRRRELLEAGLAALEGQKTTAKTDRDQLLGWCESLGLTLVIGTPAVIDNPFAYEVPAYDNMIKLGAGSGSAGLYAAFFFDQAGKLEKYAIMERDPPGLEQSLKVKVGDALQALTYGGRWEALSDVREDNLDGSRRLIATLPDLYRVKPKA